MQPAVGSTLFGIVTAVCGFAGTAAGGLISDWVCSPPFPTWDSGLSLNQHPRQMAKAVSPLSYGAGKCLGRTAKPLHPLQPKHTEHCGR